MAISSSSSSSSSDNENELAWGEKYKFQNYDLKRREIKINNLNLELEKVIKERDELKLKIEKWEESSKNLDELLNSQMSARDKTDQVMKRSIRANDRSSKADGYHAVPPPIIGNFLTLRADISFPGLDEYAIRKKTIELKTTDLNTKTSKTVEGRETRERWENGGKFEEKGKRMERKKEGGWKNMKLKKEGTYPLYYFRRRYRMRRKLFLKIVKGISTYEADPLPDHFNFFRVRPDATGRMSLSVIMKCTAAIRQLAYGTTPDAFDEYLQMSERTARDCLTHFNKCIISLYMAEYLRKPTLEDVENIYNKHLTTHGFPGMLGSIDCMHWEWKNYPVSWQGQYGRGDKKYPTIMLEAVASQDLWIWHAFFGVAGANNDINVLDNSPLFDDLLDDKAPVAPYVVNGVGFEKGYYLADGIYPQWATFVKSFTVANDAKHAYFKKRQEGARKDVERAFGVLQGRWGIIQQPARQYHVNTIRRIMYSCIIMHNMILKIRRWRFLTGTMLSDSDILREALPPVHLTQRQCMLALLQNISALSTRPPAYSCFSSAILCTYTSTAAPSPDLRDTKLDSMPPLPNSLEFGYSFKHSYWQGH
ncbi:ALP1-like protein [Tanacetum coccineum]